MHSNELKRRVAQAEKSFENRVVVRIQVRFCVARNLQEVRWPLDCKRHQRSGVRRSHNRLCPNRVIPEVVGLRHLLTEEDCKSSASRNVFADAIEMAKQALPPMHRRAIDEPQGSLESLIAALSM